MANIVVRQDGRQSIAPAVAPEPFRMMRDLLRWDPFREMAPMWPLEERMREFTPAFDVRETKDSYVFKADMPGLQVNDIEIGLTENRLTVSGKRDEEKTEQGDTWYTYERSAGSFTRSFTLPDGVDPAHIKADLTSGVLSIVVPKTPAAQPKKIAIGTGTAPKS